MSTDTFGGAVSSGNTIQVEEGKGYFHKRLWFQITLATAGMPVG